MSNFDKLGLSLPLRQTLHELGFESPTPIQKQAIPSLLENDPTDFIGLAQTGTGKTAAFGLPLIELIDIHDKATQALIMSPTRELGQQTAKMLADFLKNSKALNIEVVYGGAAITKQIRALKSPTQIVVATPGRLLDLIKRKAVSLEAVRYVVLDEADEMLNMGFKEDIDKILSNIQEDHATWLFSATMPAGIRKIISGYMSDPQEVSVIKEEKINKDIAHRYVITKAANKTAALTRFLDMQPDMQAIMFCRTRRETQSISEDLHKQGYNVEALHGDLSQSQRDAAMRRFKKHSMQLLIATDVAARGIDVSNLTHVIHHKLPDQLDYYTHRSGRTGRIGKQGISLAFITKNEGKRIAELERKTQIKFNRIEVPGMEELKSARLEKWVGSILDTDVEQRAVELFKEVEKRFEGLSKEDILLRLLTNQLRQLTHQEKKTAHLNEARDKRLDKRSDRKVGNAKKSGRTESGDRDIRKERKRDGSKYSRYFINIGSMDDVSKSELLHFLADVSGIKRKCFGQISLQKNCAYFDVDSKKDKHISDSFIGLEIEGREIRVNRDHDGKPRSRPFSSKNGRNGRGGYDRTNKHQRRRK